MPQGRRKQPFSQKQKKIQLQAKREKRREFIKSASFDQSNDNINTDPNCTSQSRSDISYAQCKLSECSLAAALKAELRSHAPFSGAGSNEVLDDLEETVPVDNLESSEDSDDEDEVSEASARGSTDNVSVCSQPYQSVVAVKRINEQPTASRNGSTSKKHSLSCFGNSLPTASNAYDANRYKLHFAKDSKQAIDARKLDAQRRVLRMLPRESLEMNIDHVFGLNEKEVLVMDMPKRPVWNYSLDKRQLERQEEKYFRDYITQFYARQQQHSHTSGTLDEESSSGSSASRGAHHALSSVGANTDQLSYFELNLETWRQLWRVLEMSDILLLICDVRHPVLHFPPSLYHHITKDLNKDVVVILNKIDLVPPEVSIAWKHYLHNKFPQLHIVLYTNDPQNFVPYLADSQGDNCSVAEKGKRMDISVFGKIKTARRKPTAKCNYAPPIGLQELLSACEKCIRNNKNKGKRDFDFTAWQYKVSKQLSRNYDYREATMCAADQRLTIGCVGHPNVGKSSVINSIIGKKVVSTSRTPGHTKHFQTHFVTCNVQLCDCPGLVFPSIVDKQQQIFSGLFPIAQVQEPYTPVGFIADRLPLVEMLGLKHPQGEGEQWTAWDVCEAWAVKRGFRIARTSKFDVYRAANHLLRLTVEGRICMATYPPNYFSEEHMWRSSEETKQLIKLVEGSKVVAAGGGWDVSESSSRSKSRDTLAIDVERNQMSDDSRSLSPGNSARSGERESENEEEGEGDNVNAQRSSPSEGGSTRKGSKKERKASDSARVANKFSELLDFSSD